MDAVTVYTVARWPRTAAAKRSAGYETRRFEFIAESSSNAVAKAVADCPWRDAAEHFGFEVVTTRVEFQAITRPLAAARAQPLPDSEGS